LKLAVEGPAAWALDRTVTLGDERMSSMMRKHLAGVLVSGFALAATVSTEAPKSRATSRTFWPAAKASKASRFSSSAVTGA
jgi:hypothetical protein